MNNTIRDIRTYILDLRPRQFHDENLMQGLTRLVNEFRANTLVEITLQGPADGIANLTASTGDGAVPYLPGSPGEHRQTCPGTPGGCGGLDHADRALMEIT